MRQALSTAEEQCPVSDAPRPGRQVSTGMANPRGLKPTARRTIPGIALAAGLPLILRGCGALLDGLGPEANTSVLEQDEEFGCGDQITFAHSDAITDFDVSTLVTP